MDSTKIKNLIFDLGGVIINLDFELTFRGFAQAYGLTADEVKSVFSASEFWNKHETGHLTDDDFRHHIAQKLNKTISDDDIDTHWNSLLLDIPVARIELLQKLSKNYRIFLLSNTNGIHQIRFNRILFETTGIENFDRIFEKVYYSHKMGYRKPDPAIYNVVLNENNLKPGETVFIDDNEDNILAANQLGIHTIHVKPPHTIIELLTHF